ncbi:hypothetical protein [Brevibacillus sp. MER 51]|uniref:hypothetical protein n=1 Tax=Brevibacillus sp. MER 51 TaxID=2939560 RepID=UPI00203E3F7C|nr:hypothetical protein [Brevibacillus sp. MER 51]MCM3145138.1 hypothetical protein [Brevibacillus sp. MER 51]
MSKFQMLADERSEEFLELTANDMVELFHIMLEEAIGRMNQEWRVLWGFIHVKSILTKKICTRNYKKYPIDRRSPTPTL